MTFETGARPGQDAAAVGSSRQGHLGLRPEGSVVRAEKCELNPAGEGDQTLPTDES